MELKKKAGGEENYFSVEKDEFIEKEGSQLSSCLKGVTIEPMILMYALGYYMVGVTTDQMIFYKTCMDPQFNFTEGFCGNIENFSNSTEYNDVEEEVARFDVSVDDATLLQGLQTKQDIFTNFEDVPLIQRKTTAFCKSLQIGVTTFQKD